MQNKVIKKLLPIALCLILPLTACARAAETRTGTAKGYGGELVVSVAMDGDKITAVDIVSHNETESVAGKALTDLPKAIVEKGNTEVDIVSGATITSNAIIAAVNNAVNPEQYPYGGASAAPTAVSDGRAMGLGIHTSGRVGPGQDAQGVPIYSFNVVMAEAIFDKDGRLLHLYVDQLEVATPNYESASMPVFSGFPGQGGYNWDQNHNGTITGKTPDTEENYLKEITDWKTKRQRGDSYRMTSGTWAEEMDTYQKLFIGKTIDEIEAWFKAYTSDRNGRPLKAGSEDAADAAKYDKLSEADKAMLADVTSTATMSLNDAHGDIIAAIRAAYDNRVDIPAVAP